MSPGWLKGPKRNPSVEFIKRHETVLLHFRIGPFLHLNGAVSPEKVISQCSL
jgi:hypothetical protein